MALGTEVSNTTGLEVKRSSIIALLVVSLACAIYGGHLGAACVASGHGILGLFLDPTGVFTAATQSTLTQPWAMFSGGIESAEYAAIGFLAPWVIFYATVLAGKRDYMFNKEHGSARWGTQHESDAFADLEDEYNNIIFSDTDRMALSPKGFNVQTDRNKNVLIMGGPGSGKTRYIIKPNAMQLNSTYIITDPKGTLVPEIGSLFAGNGTDVPKECLYRCTKDLYSYQRDSTGKVTPQLIHKTGELIPYRVKVLNLIDFAKSNHYNPLAYMRSGKDILKLTNVFMKNSSGEGKSSSDPFWDKAESLFYQAIFGYLFYCTNPSERNFSTVLDMVNMAEAREDDETYESPLDILFKYVETGKYFDPATKEYVQVAEPDPDNFCVRQYAKFKKAAGKTLKSILISCAARLAIFEEQDVRELMREDEMELDTLGDYPTALFLVIPDTDKETFKAISAMLLYQMFDLLCSHADNDCGGKLNVPVQCLLDEFANLGGIPDFDCLITTVRSRNISAQIVLQNAGQLDRDYDKAARIIKGGCDTTVYLGKADSETCKELSERMGKRTIAAASLSKTEGQSSSTSRSDQLIQRELEDPSEVERMDATECRVLISGAFPQRSKKYDLTRHPRYPYIDPGHKGAIYTDPFDAENYILARRIQGRTNGRQKGYRTYNEEEMRQIRERCNKNQQRSRRVSRDVKFRTEKLQVNTPGAKEILQKRSVSKMDISSKQSAA